MAALAGAALALGTILGTGARAAGSVVLGDSLGVGVAEVSHLPNYAHISVHIRGPRAVEQIRRAPEGVTAFVVLGTNDADGSIAHLDKSIEDILAAAEKKHLRLVWIGPPCVKKPWDTRARELDGILAAKLPPRGVVYVPMRDPAFCNGGMHDHDGVHLKNKGYLYMWDKARRMADLAPPAPLTTGSVVASAPPASPVAAAPRPASQFQLAAGPQSNSGGAGWREPKIYVLHVKRGANSAGTN
jgi:hypothetical protein